MSFSTLVFRPGLLAEIMSLLLGLQRKQKNSSNPFRIRIFLFLSVIWPINTFIHSCSSLENHTLFQTKWAHSIPVFRPKRRKKPYPDGAAHTYIAYIREYPPRGGGQNVHDLHILDAVAVSKINIFRVARVSKTTFVRRQGDLATVQGCIPQSRQPFRRS